MARQMYESQHDWDTEQAVINLVAEKTGRSFFKLPVSHHIDFALCDESGEVTSLVEVRRRNFDHDRYPTFFFSVRKRMTSLALAHDMGVAALLAVRWDDGVYVIDMAEVPDKTTINGNKKRNDGHDIEPVHHYAIDRFSFLGVLQ